MSVQSEVRQFIVESFLFGEEGGFNDEDSFLDKGLIDSTGILEVVSFIEEEYGIEVDDEELVPENLDSVKRLSAFVERKRG